MNRFDRIASWIVVAAYVLVVGGGLGFWWLNATVIAPSCGDVAEAQLHQAVQEMQGRIPSLQDVEFADSCDSLGEVYALWEIDDADQVRIEATAAGCRVTETDPADVEADDASESFTCKTAGRDVVLTFDPNTDPVEGELSLP